MNKIVFKKGESVTIGFLLNSEYDMSRIQSASAWVGGKKFALATIDHMLRCELASDETHKLSGNYKLILWIDDSTLGVKKIHAADIEISTNNSNDNNSSTNEGYDFVFNITINETAIQAGDVLYNYVKGDNADLPVGIVIDPDYIHTDNNYDDAAVAEVAKIASKANSSDVYTKSETYTQTEINNKLSAVYKFKGSVLTYDLLPTDAENADVWNVVNGITPELNGMNYAWNSTLSAWDAIGGIVGLATLTENGLMSKEDFKKLSDLYTKEDLDLILANKSDVGHNHSGETINPDAIDFDLTPTTDPNIQGRMQYSPTERTIEFGVEGGTIDVNKELFDYYVDTNNDLVEGNVVSVTGISGNRQAVTKTNHTQRASATACIGMVTHKNADNTVRVTKSGRVRKLNTGGMTEGLPVYANATGGFTQTEPSPGDYFIHVGIVEVAHSVNGVIDVDIRIVYDVEDLSNVDGAATTVGSGDSFFIKVGNLWKTITESNFLSWFRGLSHTWSLIQDFAAGLKTDSITKRNGSGLYKLQDVGTEWYITKWFTPTGTFSSVGTAVTTTGGQLTSAMVGAKIGVGEDKRVITAFLTSNTCTVDSAYSQDYSGVVSGSWGVYSKAFQLFFYGTYAGIKSWNSNGEIQIDGDIYGQLKLSKLATPDGTVEITNANHRVSNGYAIRWSNDGTYYSTKDTGIRRVSDGLLEIFNGITNGTLRDLKLRSLYGDKIFLNSLSTAPSSATDTGTKGEIRIDANYIYFCVATNQWKRTPLSTW